MAYLALVYLFYLRIAKILYYHLATAFEPGSIYNKKSGHSESQIVKDTIDHEYSYNRSKYDSDNCKCLLASSSASSILFLS